MQEQVNLPVVIGFDEMSEQSMGKLMLCYCINWGEYEPILSKGIIVIKSELLLNK